MGIVNVGKVGANIVDFTGYSGEGNYPSLGTGDAGSLIYDTSAKKLILWTGSEWEEVKTKGTLGLDASNPAASPAAILANDPSSANGVYWLNHGSGAYQTYIDMTNGGYILSKSPEEIKLSSIINAVDEKIKTVGWETYTGARTCSSTHPVSCVVQQTVHSTHLSF